MAEELKTPPNVSWRTYLSQDELKALRKPSDMKAFSMFAFNWAVIFFCFGVIAHSPSILVTIIALFVMAGRQLGIGILLHECSHRSFFSSPKVNEFVGHWFGGMPILVPFHFYRPTHLSHHSKTGTAEDPDVENIRQYPVSKASFLRKVIRDFVGLSGLKMLYGILFYVLPHRSGDAVSLGINKDQTLSQDEQRQIVKRNFTHAMIAQGIFFLCFFATGLPELYIYWWICFIFFYPFILRMRQIAEHGAMTQLASEDVRLTTRTTIAAWWERVLFAPNYVNYHCEHHFLPTVPSYRLSHLHELLKIRGFYSEQPNALVEEGGYWAVARLAMSR